MTEDATAEEEPPAAHPMTRLVADADVLAADVLVGGSSRAALDLARSHEWIRVVASDALLEDAAAVLTALAGPELAAVWCDRIRSLAAIVSHTCGGHPAIEAAAAGDARHVLSLDPGLQGAGAGMAIRRTADLEVSVRSPDTFVRLFDPADVYEAVYGSSYPGPDRDPRE